MRELISHNLTLDPTGPYPLKNKQYLLWRTVESQKSFEFLTLNRTLSVDTDLLSPSRFDVEAHRDEFRNTFFSFMGKVGVAGKVFLDGAIPNPKINE